MIKASGLRDFSVNYGALIFQRESVFTYYLVLRFSERAADESGVCSTPKIN